MSYRSELQLIDCKTMADVGAKYTSDSARKLYSYLLCKATMDSAPADCDDYSCLSPTDENVAAINKIIKQDIDTDIGKVVDTLYNECTMYIADMTKKGIMQLLPASVLTRIKNLLNGFTESYEQFCRRKPKQFIYDGLDHESIEDDDKQINHCNLLFPISFDNVYGYISSIQVSIDKLNHNIHTLVTDSLMDALIDAAPKPNIVPNTITITAE